MRWEYAAPNPITVVIDGNEMTTWYRDLGRADKLKVGRYSNQVGELTAAFGEANRHLRQRITRARLQRPLRQLETFLTRCGTVSIANMQSSRMGAGVYHTGDRLPIIFKNWSAGRALITRSRTGASQ